MAFSYSCLTLQRVVLPTVLVLAALSRPVGISFVYLLMFFISPFIPVATQRNFKGTVTAYFIILIALSTILLLCHIALQVIIIALKIDTLFGTCSFTEQLLRHVGFVDLRNISILAITEWLAPDVAVFITSLATYLVTKKLTVPPSPIQVENGEVNETRDSALSADVVEEEHPNFQRLIKISPLFCLATLFFAAVLRPSVPGGFYFLIFLLSGSYWATFQSLQRGFAVLLRFVMIVIVLHAICIVAYQTPWMQEHLDSKSLAARLVGLEPLIISKCANDIRIITYDTNFKFDSFLNPIVLFFSYYALALTSNNLIVVSLRRQQRPVTTIEPTETTPLVQRHGTIKRKSSTTNVTSADIPLEMHDDKSLDFVLTSTICDQIWYGIASIGGFIYQNSYIFTNILMMTWSIVYHSWLTFVLLLWANVLWMIPNQRKAMMRSSPFIVIYAELLLIAQYIYGMDLNNDELPSKVDTAGINLAQIGLERPQENGMQPCVPLIVKTAFLLMFWVTSRQFFKEKVEKRRSTLADMIAPLQLGFTSSDIGPSSGRKTSKFLKMAGDIIKYLLVRLWIWLLVLVIFLCAITGKQMTGFRICYMALFLFFLLVFQSSSKVWVKVMYGFWLFLIFYAMSILILIYTYQFDKFDQYWYDYLNISKTLQTDIGLERYKTKDLFLHLVSPTIIVILTVIQVHYFHKRFIATLQEPVIPTPREPASLNIYAHKGSRIGSRHSSIAPPNNVLTDTTALIRLTLKQILKKIKRILKNFKNLFWRFLEVHIIKAVYITAFVCAVSEVCLLHVAFVTLCLIGVISRSSVQVFISRIISFIVTIIIISKMIYQIAYLHHDKYDVHCPKSNYTENNAAWFGLIKASPETGGLIGLLKKYIIYMVMVTLHAVVSLRQLQMRTLNGTQNESIPKVLFPLITRADAEKNLEKMTKYLLNYGFFKFGLEISLITLVATIAFRQDIIAVAYAFWLPVLLVFDRSKCSKIWGILQIFVFFSLLLQYVVLVGLPPSLCLTYPWVESSYSHSIQRWAMLPGPLHYNHVPKLIFDFILLLVINRQKRVFYIETRAGQNYPGGSNQSIVHEIANLGLPNFENPTHDFLSHVRNYLDVFKYAILCGFFWVTLAVVFLAGTNIGDLLALGYLIGAFVFLWEGSDYYLRPIQTIIRRWKWLITYNVVNIVVKTCLQMAGCLFKDTLTKNCCWLVHILGITCSSNQIHHDGDEDDIWTGDCPVIKRHVALLWDAICFAFLILQLRIFKSYYFCHIIIDTKANNILASRGAEIIEDLRQKQIEHRQEHEQDVLVKIKRKMERIRATQQKMLKPAERISHVDDFGNPLPGSRIHKRIKLHPQAVRAGDYYMFEDLDDKFELDMIEDEKDFLEDEDTSKKRLSRRKTLANVEQSNKEEASTVESKEIASAPSTSKQAPPEKPTESKTKKETEISEESYKDSDDEIEANPIARLLEGFVVSVTMFMNRFSRNYRYVNKILCEEKTALKDSKHIHDLVRSGASTIFATIRRNINSDDNEGALAAPSSSVRTSNDAQNELSAPPQSNTNRSNNESAFTTANVPPIQSQAQAQLLEQQPSPTPDQSQSQIPHVVNINEISQDTIDARNISYTATSSSSLTKGVAEFALQEEDFTTRDHHILIEFLISSWYALLSNTDLICYIVVFINQVVNASIISLPLPIMVFMWGTLSLPRPTKTFWVTMIAYTQANVLIKCIFQYKLIWANYINLPNQPLAPAKIFGVELNPNYASYDLLLLLVLFFHRFILKLHGLWKSEYRDSVRMRMAASGSVNELEREEEDETNVANENTRPNSDNGNQSDDRSHNAESGKYTKKIKRLKRTRYFSSVHKFFVNLVKKPRLPSDVYALMFLCDFINFFVLLFGFTAFGSQQSEGEGNGGVQTYLAENKVPIPFLIMLLVQFILIVIDRALYLRKALVNKIIFHFLSVIGIHIWMFFIVPLVTERSFYSLAPPIIFYIIKCFYMLLSSYQIKCGYPKRILGNFLTKGFSLANMISFKVYMLIPFLYELRTILDWVCTDTTMTLFDWLKMEDIFSDIYFIKCSRQMETDFPAIRAQKKPLISKLFMGGTIILLIVVSIWGPLCLFALGNAVGQSNLPIEVSMSIRIGSYDPIYQTQNRESTIAFDENMYTSMQNAYIKDKAAITFLSGYDSGDIAAIKLAGNSPSLWTISPPDKERLLKELKNDTTMVTRFTYSFTRIPPAKGLVGTVSSEVTHELNEEFNGREAMINMLEGHPTSDVVVLPNIMPKFIKVLNSGEVGVVQVLMSRNQTYRPLIIKMHSASENGTGIWWEIRDFCNDTYHTNVLSKLPLVNCNSGVVLYTFNDKKFPSTFSFLTAGGIIGLYTTFVLLASRVLKSFIAGQNRKIMFEDLPYVDRVLQLCLDIYLVREALEFALEEDLFAKLIFLYRSPETMIKWTRPKEETNEDETDTESVRSRHSTRRPESSIVT